MEMKFARHRLRKVGLPPHDLSSEGLMDYLETHNAKLAGGIKA